MREILVVALLAALFALTFDHSKWKFFRQVVTPDGPDKSSILKPPPVDQPPVSGGGKRKRHRS
jgi:hypothetical protein